MVGLAVILTVAFARILFRSRLELMVENLALRQQLAVLKRKRSRPALRPADRAFWVVLRQIWPGWVNASQELNELFWHNRRTLLPCNAWVTTSEARYPLRAVAHRRST